MAEVVLLIQAVGEEEGGVAAHLAQRCVVHQNHAVVLQVGAPKRPGNLGLDVPQCRFVAMVQSVG